MRLIVRPNDMVWIGLILLVLINWLVNSIVNAVRRFGNRHRLP